MSIKTLGSWIVLQSAKRAEREMEEQYTRWWHGFLLGLVTESQVHACARSDSFPVRSHTARYGPRRRFLQLSSLCFLLVVIETDAP